MSGALRERLTSDSYLPIEAKLSAALPLNVLPGVSLSEADIDSSGGLAFR